MRTRIVARHIYSQGGRVDQGSIVIEDDRIFAVEHERRVRKGERLVDCSQYSILPGYIDLHVNGAGGADVTEDGSVAAVHTMSTTLSRFGITGFLPTICSAPLPQSERALRAAAAGLGEATRGARPLGVNFEGPFLNPESAAGRLPDQIRLPSIAELDRAWEITAGALKILTVAPELEGAIPLIRHARELGILVSLGHSLADYVTALAAIQAGASLGTHVFNGMIGLHHRRPGIVGAILTNADIMACVVVDPTHVLAPMVDIVLRCKGIADVIAVSDAIEGLGMPDGTYRLMGQLVRVEKGTAKYEHAWPDHPAGTVRPISDTLGELRRNLELSVENVIQLGALNPARALGVDHLYGSIASGKVADLIVCNDDLTPVMTIVGGRVVHRSPGVFTGGRESL